MYPTKCAYVEPKSGRVYKAPASSSSVVFRLGGGLHMGAFCTIFFTPPLAGESTKSCALPPVDLRAVCLTRAILLH